jgi:hypothetical protein
MEVFDVIIGKLLCFFDLHSAMREKVTRTTFTKGKDDTMIYRCHLVK